MKSYGTMNDNWWTRTQICRLNAIKEEGEKKGRSFVEELSRLWNEGKDNVVLFMIAGDEAGAIPKEYLSEEVFLIRKNHGMTVLQMLCNDVILRRITKENRREIISLESLTQAVRVDLGLTANNVTLDIINNQEDLDSIEWDSFS